MCFCMCEREEECVIKYLKCSFVCERERMCAFVFENERKCVFVCVREREKEKV